MSRISNIVEFSSSLQLTLKRQIKSIRKYKQINVEYLKKNPEEVCEYPWSTTTPSPCICSVGEVVEHVGHSAGEGQHDHEESDEEHSHILQ